MNVTNTPIASRILSTYQRPVKAPPSRNGNRRWGTDSPLTKDQLIQRFLWFVEPQSNGCWNWIGCRVHSEHRLQYGTIRVNGEDVRAHRLSYELFVGPIPEGLCVCHKCDVPWCVCPDHFFAGTNAENLQDMRSKGRNRFPSGEDHYKCKITEDQVLEIRSLHSQGGLSHQAIADMFGVARTTVSSIVRGERR